MSHKPASPDLIDRAIGMIPESVAKGLRAVALVGTLLVLGDHFKNDIRAVLDAVPTVPAGGDELGRYFGGVNAPAEESE